MTEQEKLNAIVERIKVDDATFSAEMVSLMVIIGYLDAMEKMGLVQCAFNMTKLGQSVMAICEEFDWKPSDVDVIKFVRDMVPQSDWEGFAYMIIKYRDDRDQLKEDLRKYREKQGLGE